MQLRLTSLLGLIVFLVLAWALSSDRGKFPRRVVIWGLALQVTFALLILRTVPGQWFFDFFQRAFLRLNSFAMDGAAMIFGPLASGDAMSTAFGPGTGVTLAIIVMATIILVASLSALLYHWGVLQLAVEGMARVMQRTMGTSGSESLAAAANIFMGQTEAPLVIKPYLDSMTRSEILAMMTGGMATIAGGVLAVYTGFGANAGHLLTASVLSAPGALLVAKIMMPETETSPTAGHVRVRVERGTVNSFDALCQGASDGLKLSLNVLAMLVAFVAVVALANFLIGAVAGWFGASLTLQQLFGWINAPFAWLMGIPAKDCVLVGQMLGERIVINEFVGYLTLTQNTAALDSRSATIATYALCGFANFSSVAIQIGGIGSLAPGRRAELARLGLRSMVGGLLACYVTACIVGLLGAG
ncbi:MAG TPA: Na+ dependent nucleoside transporter domain protein [Verrucomicrobiales bacterium]|nr:Na+ dependent nucleoside transporter domain protein [Verrucomicrobiales bacterium]